MLNLGQLNIAAVKNRLSDLGRRSAVVAPAHALLYWFGFVNSMSLYGDRSYWLGFTAIVVLAAIRYLLYRLSDRMLNSAVGQSVWRVLFGVSTVAVGLVWGLSCAGKFLEFGINSTTVMTLTLCMAIAAHSAAAFSFDFIPATLFQLLVLLPPAYVLAVQVVDPAANQLGIGVGLFLTLMTYTASGLTRFQFNLIIDADTIEQQKRALAKTNELMTTMLESIDEGFLMLDEQGVVYNQTSETTKELLGMNPDGLKLVEVLRIEERNRKAIESWYDLLIREKLKFADMVGVGPQRIEIPETGTILSLKYHPVRKADGKIRGVTLAAVNITREVQAEKKAEEAIEGANLILRIHENRIGFRIFLEQFESTLKMLAHWQGLDLSTLRRDIHTLKGTSAVFGAQTLERAIHEMELKIRKADEMSAVTEVLIHEAAAVLNQSFYAWRNRGMDLFLQLGVFEHNYVEISRRKLSEMNIKVARDPVAATLYRKFIRDLLSTDFSELLKDFEFHIEKISLRLGKKVRFQIVPSSETLLVAPEAYRETLRSFIHLFNNAVDHGIETPVERIAKGKSEDGTIRVSYKVVMQEDRSWIRILLEDDGRGIHLVDRRKRERSAAPMTSDENLKAAHGIFRDGYTTREQVSDISGQGIGMGSVRAAVLKAGGTIRIVKTDVQGTSFEVLLPYTSLEAKLRVA